jgi:acetoin utilization deacetylase AcuC-like enzyme
MKVFYRPEQSCAEANSYSPSAGKPALVVQDWLSEGLISGDDIIGFDPLNDGDISKAHDPYYVSAILSSRMENGFNNTDSAIANSLLFTSGSLVAAAEYALEHGEHTSSPTSGFHHAGWNFSQGFCTFNGLMVASALLKRSGHAKKIGILDCDMHWGNGTEDIIKRKKIDYVVHRSQGAEFHGGDAGRDGSKFFDWLTAAIYDMQSCDIILYQAGADPHINDPLGGLLTTDQLSQRDAIVFREFKDKPLAWTLAGGYQRTPDGRIDPVLEIHRNTAKQCIKN